MPAEPSLCSAPSHERLQQAISDDGGADAPAAGGLAGDGGADPLPPRAGVHRDLRARAGAPEDGLPDRERGAGVRRLRAPARWSRPSRTWSRPATSALVASCGKFGQRWAELCDAYGAETVHLEFEWGEKVDPAEVERALAERGRRGEGALHDPVGDLDRRPQRRRARWPRSPPARRRDRRRRGLRPRRGRPADRRLGRRRGRVRLPEGADVARPAWPSRRSRSARSTPPPTPARAAPATTTSTGSAPLKGQRKEPPDSPFTPAVTLVRALDVALEHDRGRDAAGRVRAPRACSAGPRARRSRRMGLELFGPEDENANVVTAVRTPEGIDGAAIPKLMRDRYGITIAGGQGHLKGKIVRIAHCGYYGAFDILSTIAALEMALDELGRRRHLRRRRVARAAGFRAAGSQRGPAGRLSRRAVPMSENGYRVLVKEKIADAGVELLRAALRRRRAHRHARGGAAGGDRRLRRDRDPLRHEADGRPDRARRPPEGDRPRRHRRRQRRRAGRHQARHHRRQRARVEHRRRRRAHDRDAARAGAQHPAGARLAEERQVGAQQVRRRGGVREDARDPRLRPDRPARRRARAGLRHGGHRLRPLRVGRALPRAGGRAGRRRRRPSTRAPT